MTVEDPDTHERRECLYFPKWAATKPWLCGACKRGWMYGLLDGEQCPHCGARTVREAGVQVRGGMA